MTFSIMGYLVIGVLGVLAVIMSLRPNILVPNKSTNAGVMKRRSSEKPASRIKNSFRSTAIISGKNACEAVGAIEGKRFLISHNDLPQLPLPNCDAASCACLFTHHLDRRENDELRRGPPGLRTELYRHIENVERRLKKGRRTSDWD